MDEYPINSQLPPEMADFLTSEGTEVREFVIPNPVTGQKFSIIFEAVLQFINYRPFKRWRAIPIVGICGDAIFDPAMVCFCAITQLPCCRSCMVVCPFCARNVSLVMSELMNFDGLFLRVCRDCLPRAMTNPITLPRPTLPLMPGLGGYLP